MTALQRVKNICLGGGLLLLIAAQPTWAYDYSSSLGPADPMVDMPIYEDPPVHESQSYPVFNPRLIEVWKAGLNRPDADTRRRIADAVAEAHTMGMEGLREAFAERMSKELIKPEQHRLVRLAMANTLVTLDAREAAPALLAASNADGLEMARITDAALAKWDYAPARSMWLDRIADADAPAQLRIIAAEALAQVGEKRSLEILEPLVASSITPVQLRLAAAAAVGRLAPESSAKLAGDLARNGSMVEKLAAIALLSHTDSKPARDLLVSLTGAQQDGALVAAAMRRIIEIDPLLLKADAARLADHADGSVRGLAVQVLAADRAKASIPPLAKLLDDALPRVSRAARDVLIDFAGDKALYGDVTAASVKVLQDAGWRGQEQAALVLGKLDHEPAFDLLLQRIDAERVEVAIAAATAVRWLAIESKLGEVLKVADRIEGETIAMLKAIDSLPPEEEQSAEPQDRRNRNQPQEPETPADPLADPKYQALQRVRYDLINAQLFQLFGRLKYAPAEAVLMKYVPKKITETIRYGTESRTAAVWALGLIHEGNNDAQLAGQLRGRMVDNNMMDPEAEFVRRASAIALARMGATGAAGTMRSLFDTEGYDTVIGAGAIRAWSMLTGNPAPEHTPAAYEQTNWFIAPIERMGSGGS